MYNIKNVDLIEDIDTETSVEDERARLSKSNEEILLITHHFPTILKAVDLSIFINQKLKG